MEGRPGQKSKQIFWRSIVDLDSLLSIWIVDLDSRFGLTIVELDSRFGSTIVDLDSRFWIADSG